MKLQIEGEDEPVVGIRLHSTGNGIGVLLNGEVAALISIYNNKLSLELMPITSAASRFTNVDSKGFIQVIP